MTQVYIKQNIRNIGHKSFEELVPSVSPLLKKHIRLGHAGIVDHSVDLSIPDFKKSIKKKGMDRSNKKILKYYSKILYKCMTANTSVIWQHAAHTTDLKALTNFNPRRYSEAPQTHQEKTPV